MTSVCFVLPDGRRSGGTDVARAHAEGLRRDHGVEAELVQVDGEPVSLDGGVPVLSVADAASRRYDLAVATWWQTIPALSRLNAAREVTFLQSFEQRFYEDTAPLERLSAECTLAMSVDFIAVAGWIRDLLAELRDGARCWVVRPGIDKDRFTAEREIRRDGPLRVLVEGQPSLPFKGVAEAVAAIARMREPVHTTLVGLDVSEADSLPLDRVESGLDPDGMAALYRDSDVLVKLSRVEGLGLAPIEGFHSGLPCVVTPFTGHAEYARHRENAMVVGFDDPVGTAATLDELARDRSLLERLSAGARETAAGWPSRAESTSALHTAIGEILGAEPPQADEALLLRTLALGTELGRAQVRHAAEMQRALAVAQELVHELSASRDECGERLEAADAELDRIRRSPGYRVGRAAKRAVGMLRRR